MVGTAKKGRTLRIVSRSRAGVLVKIATARTSDLYLVRAIPCDIGGEGFAFGKVDGDKPTCHHVRLEDGRASCDCPGFTFRGGCKHASALPVLRKLGHI